MFVEKEEWYDYHTSDHHCVTQRHRAAAEQNEQSLESAVNYVTQGKMYLALQRINETCYLIQLYAILSLKVSSSTWPIYKASL